MAIFNYIKEEIKALKPEDGELALLNFLEELDDSYEVYFQPNLNMDRPDIIILRKEYGVLVIEVKNFNSINSFVYNQEYNKESPAEQVERYKNNLYDFHINGLAEKKAVKKAYYGIVKCALYLHGYTEEKAKAKLLEYDKEYKNHSEWYSVIGKDSLNINTFQKILSLKKDLFTNELYKEFKHVLEPSITDKEQVAKPVYNPVQNELINKLEPKQQKIKGPAGSGKTLILAQRAVNAHKRTRGNILVLTYNITLKNYILDKISVVKENLRRKDFVGILNYHAFIKFEANNYGLKPSIIDFENELFFESVKKEIKKYDAIFIDEIQDYKTEWIRIIKKYFLAENGEFIIFGDGKQKIYEEADTDMDSDESPNTTIKGKWNVKLTKNYRMFGKIGRYTNYFSKYFFGTLFEDKQQEFELPLKNKVLFIKHGYPESINTEKLILLIGEFCKKNHIKESEICIISSKTETVREIDYFYRENNPGKHSQTTFASQETFNQLIGTLSQQKLDDELKTIGRSKKYNFYLNPGCIKLSTIHSFKGWEAPYIFLILDKDEQSDKLIYTAITRARYGLYVINLGNKKYNDFFVTFDSGN